ncbi:hypothetical protein HY404_03035 [Candidatus Microgenomates bacterium]|nr:hypothetical protein [Candidatus Microgenomates bacterium]
MLTKRTNILFDQELWKKLISLAEKRSISIGELVRTAVRKQYLNDIAEEQRKEAIVGIKAFREKYGKTAGGGEDSALIIRRMRDSRYGK